MIVAPESMPVARSRTISALCHVRDDYTFVQYTPDPSPHYLVHGNQSQAAKTKVVASPFPAPQVYYSSPDIPCWSRRSRDSKAAISLRRGSNVLPFGTSIKAWTRNKIRKSGYLSMIGEMKVICYHFRCRRGIPIEGRKRGSLFPCD